MAKLITFWRYLIKFGHLDWLVFIWLGFMIFLFLPCIWGDCPEKLTRIISYWILGGVTLMWVIGDYIYYTKRIKP